MAHEADDAFREIQLNGKQLVFLFMVATVVSVVIFLCGVFVGRGVRAERTPLLTEAPSPTPPATTPDVVASQAPPTPAADADPRNAAPPPAVDELSYFNRLEKKEQAKEELTPPAPAKASAKAAAPAKAVAPAPAPKSAPPPAVPAPQPVAAAVPPPIKESVPAAVPTVAAGDPAASGFTLQVTALKERSEAEAIVKRLSSKGYSAYILTPAKGASSVVYRVRVGRFKTRREAEAMATRLQKDEQITPWVTR